MQKLRATSFSSGRVYSPASLRALHASTISLQSEKKIIKIIEEEMDAIGGQEVQMPTLQPSAIWKESGRWESMGDIMFRLEDRHGGEAALGVTAEEIFATVASEISSYKQLPQMWYQIHTKFRDEPRPKVDCFESVNSQ